jgi:tetratricopeptide (TPR) repeat protein
VNFRNDGDAGQRLFEAALSYDSTLYVNAVNLAMLHMQRSNYGQAEEYLKSALRVNTNNRMALAAYLEVSSRKERLHEALDWLELIAVEKESTENKEVFALLANYLEQENKFPERLQRYRQIVQNQ